MVGIKLALVKDVAASVTMLVNLVEKDSINHQQADQLKKNIIKTIVEKNIYRKNLIVICITCMQ